MIEASLGDDGPVFLVDESEISKFDKKVFRLRDRAILPITAKEAQKIVVEPKGEEIRAAARVAAMDDSRAAADTATVEFVAGPGDAIVCPRGPEVGGQPPSPDRGARRFRTTPVPHPADRRARGDCAGVAKRRLQLRANALVGRLVRRCERAPAMGLKFSSDLLLGKLRVFFKG